MGKIELLMCNKHDNYSLDNNCELFYMNINSLYLQHESEKIENLYIQVFVYAIYGYQYSENDMKPRTEF